MVSIINDNCYEDQWQIQSLIDRGSNYNFQRGVNPENKCSHHSIPANQFAVLNAFKSQVFTATVKARMTLTLVR